jgi:hypothetical protein
MASTQESAIAGRSHRLLLYGGHDPRICGRSIGGQVYWQLGYPEKGLALGRAALALAERIAHALSYPCFL